jgi:hypothetical protein
MRARLLLPLLALTAVLPSGVAQAADMPIQPGASASSPVGGCTLNFVFDDQHGTRYIAIAGHCINLGHRASASGIGQFGTCVFDVHVGTDDFALIRIDADKLHHVNPQMRGWGGPTGYTVWTDTEQGDLLLFHGYGLGLGTTSVTRSRVGVLMGDTTRQYHAQGPISPGDSGGPVLHEATGKAFGLANNAQPPTTTAGGSTIERLIERAAEDGFELTLVTAPYTRPR